MAVSDPVQAQNAIGEAGDDAAPASPPRASVMRNAALESLKSIARRLFQLTVIVATLVIAATAGVLSARSMIRNGSPLSTVTYGPWVSWRQAGRADADPYTRAHFQSLSILRLTADSAGVFEANSDAQGAYLHSSCDYVLEGPYARGLWWSIAVFDSTGKLIANDANRHAFTSDTAAPNPDGSYIVTLGRDARPGNWLPTGGAGRLIAVFTILDPATGLSDEQRANRYKMLPEIRRENCS